MDQVILLRITDGKCWHYIAMKSLSRLLQKITWNNDCNYYCMNCHYSFRTEESVCNDNDYCHMNCLRKIEKSWIIIIIQSLHPQICCLKKLLDVVIIQKDLPQKKTNKHKASDYLLFTHCSFDSSKSKYSFCRSADFMKNLYVDLKEQTTEIFNYEKKEMLTLTSRMNRTIVKDFLISARTSFMMLMIAMMILVIKEMMIVMMMYLTPETIVMIL